VCGIDDLYSKPFLESWFLVRLYGKTNYGEQRQYDTGKDLRRGEVTPTWWLALAQILDNELAAFAAAYEKERMPNLPAEMSAQRKRDEKAMGRVGAPGSRKS